MKKLLLIITCLVSINYAQYEAESEYGVIQPVVITPDTSLTSFEAILALDDTARTLSSLLDTTYNLNGGWLELFNYYPGIRVIHGLADSIGVDTSNIGHVLYFTDSYRDDQGIYKSTDNCYVKSDSTLGYVRIKGVHR